MATITNPNPPLIFNGSLTARTQTKYLIIHHCAGSLTVHQVHDDHKNNQGYAGIGYNFYIHTNGTIYKGRGWDYVGAHCTNYNDKSVGICLQGNYETTATVPNAQRQALVELISDAFSKYTFTSTGGHKDYGSTACPGRYMPYNHLINCGRIYTNVKSAANKLQTQSIINTASYWYNNFHQLEYLGELIIKMANAPKISGTNSIANVTAAINKLYDKGIIDTKTYWTNNYNNVTYLGDLLIAVAKKV